jgi:pyruvate dehydrogenase E2 component (dihydrolipoamide acetyltransferase)
MVTRIVMPPLGDTDDEATVSKWYKREGDRVEKGEPLFEVETGKVTLDVESYGVGVLRRIVVAAGNTADVGDVLAYVGEPDDVLPD